MFFIASRAFANRNLPPTRHILGAFFLSLVPLLTFCIPPVLAAHPCDLSSNDRLPVLLQGEDQEGLPGGRVGGGTR